MVADSILDLLGNTPIVRLSRLCASEKVSATLFLKLESQNPGGSHKARIAHAMILRAEQRGDLQRGSGQTVLESTGGNTGLGLAIACNIYGYKLVLVIPDNYSPEKQRLLLLYGATIIQSKSGDGNNSHIELATRLKLQHPDWVWPNQQRNPANPEIHRRTTAPEIIAALQDQSVDILVGGVGTGGHITGVGEILKQRWPHMKVVVVQPQGNDFRNRLFSPHRIQGLAVGILPENLNTRLVDDYVSISYDDAIRAVRKLIDTEGIGVGISSGANIAACLQLAHEKPNLRIISFAYDDVSQYLDQFADVDDAEPYGDNLKIESVT
jgi:cysteine synthase